MTKTCACYFTKRSRGLFIGVVLLTGGSLFGLAFVDFSPRQQLLFNESPSMPIGYYRLQSPVDTKQLNRQTTVVYPIPPRALQLVETRHYSHPANPFIKPLTAMPGDSVCTAKRQVIVNGHWHGGIRENDSLGRPLPWHQFCGIVPEGFFYSFTSHPDSFDSRHYGPVPLTSILAKATALWTW